MSKYTTEVRWICEDIWTKAGKTLGYEYVDIYKICEFAAPSIFVPYPIYNEDYRNILNTKILMHFYTREIGLETVSLWKLFLNRKLMEIMPYYNQLYQSTEIKYNPLYNYDVTYEHEGKENKKGDVNDKYNSTVNSAGSGESEAMQAQNSEAKSSSMQQDDSITKHSDTPQSSLGEDILNKYLSSAEGLESKHLATNEEEQSATSQNTSEYSTKSDSQHNSENNQLSVYNTVDSYINHFFGKMPGESYPALIKEWRESFLNIDMQIIDELKDLFMQIY